MDSRLATFIIALILALWGSLIYWLVAPKIAEYEAVQGSEAVTEAAPGEDAADGQSGEGSEDAATDTAAASSTDSASSGDQPVVAAVDAVASTAAPDAAPQEPAPLSDADFLRETVALREFEQLSRKGDQLVRLLSEDIPNAGSVSSLLGEEMAVLVAAEVKAVQSAGVGAVNVELETSNGTAIRFWNVADRGEGWVFRSGETGRRVAALLIVSTENMGRKLINGRPVGVFSDADFGQRSAQRLWDGHMAGINARRAQAAAAARSIALEDAIKERDVWIRSLGTVRIRLEELITCEQAGVTSCNTAGRLTDIHNYLEPRGISVLALRTDDDTLNSLADKVVNAVRERAQLASDKVTQLQVADR